MKKRYDICDWPGCENKMLCCTGNAGGARVCSTHFSITNGKAAEDLSEHEIKMMYMMADKKFNRN